MIEATNENPGCANNRESALYASAHSSYQILRFPNAPAAMMLMYSPTGFPFRFLRFKVRGNNGKCPLTFLLLDCNSQPRLNLSFYLRQDQWG